MIVPPDAFDLWLNCNAVDAETAGTLIAPAPEDLLEAYEVSSAVNRTANDHAQLVEPNSATESEPVPKRAAAAGRRSARARKDDGQGVLF